MAKERLTEERKQQLEELYSSLHRHNFYTILDVTPDADRGTIRKAYFSLSKLCHPDNYAEKDLGSYIGYMEKIFQACSKAYDVLGNEKKRERYDEYLEKKKSTAEYATNVMQQEASLARALEEAARKRAEASESVTMRPPDAVEVPEQPAPAPPPPSDSAPRPVPSPAPRPSVPRDSRLDPARREEHERRRRSWTRDSARRRLMGAVGGVRAVEAADRGGNWVAEARKAHEGGETLSAINALRMALDMNPKNTEAKKLLDELMMEASGELGQRYYEQAMSEIEFGETSVALASVEKAVKLCPDRPAYLALAAKVILDADGDLHRAYDFAQKAAQQEPRTASHQLLLGKILLKAGLPARARSALTKASELNPRLKEVKGLLAKL
jgi:curved DNA-binding protein CbpA